MPINHIKETEYLKREIGYNYFAPIANFLDNTSPYDDRNKEAVDGINKLEVPPHFKFKYGFMNQNLFYYAKANILYTIYESEQYDKTDLNEIRINSLRRSEQTLRAVLKRLAFEEELAFLKNNYEKSEHLSLLNSIDRNNEALEAKKQEIYSFLTSNGIEPAELDKYFQYKEQGVTYPETRGARITHMLRCRYLIAQINTAQNLHTRAYYIIRDAIINLWLHSEDQRNVEKGEEKENESVEVKDAADPKKKPQDNKGDSKKDTKKPGKGQDNEEAERKLQEERLKKLEEQAALFRKRAEERKYRHIMNAFWWFKLRTELCKILYRQNKLSDCQKVIAKVLEDCSQLSERYFERHLGEISGRIAIKQGNLAQGRTMLENAVKHAVDFYQDDLEYGLLLGDYAEVQAERGHLKTALDFYKEAIKFFSALLGIMKFDFAPKSVNSRAIEEGIKASDDLELQPEEEQMIFQKSDKAKGKKDDKKGAKDDKKKPDPKQKGKIEVQEAVTEWLTPVLSPILPLDFSVENKRLFIPLDEKVCAVKQTFTIYSKNYEYFLKAVLNAARLLLLNENSADKGMLQDLEKAESLLNMLYNVPISFRYNLHYLAGRYYKLLFINGVKEIHKQYEKTAVEKKVKKYRKLVEKLPHKDLCRNKYMLDIPNFSKQLLELRKDLRNAQDHLKRVLVLLKGECLLLEGGLKVEEVFIEMADVSLLMREYRPRINFKYVTSETVPEEFLEKNPNFGKTSEEQVTEDKECYELER